ncbi:MAG: maleylpyruvate isomerase family mycothiol-dependent enzyme [Acidobacteriota bacterium]
MKKPEPLIVVDLFPLLLDGLLELLASLSPSDWQKATVCKDWSVKDLAAHLLGGDVGILSRKRDGFAFVNKSIDSWAELVAFINELNAVWVQAAGRFSPRLLCELLRLTGEQVCDYFKTLDPWAVGDPVSWAGDEPAPVWLDLAREYTERWHHQQQIRDAVQRPGMKEPKFFAPVLDAFVRALPHTYRNVEADENTLVTLTITGAAGGRWSLLRETQMWNLYLDVERQPDAELVMDEDLAWRLFTKGVNKDQAHRVVTFKGDERFALNALNMISVIA